ncbi:MAG: hypothetical protein FJ276_01410 [Planctomycetes bacterium]|nr:hypothetical protein [Planctomycetota bacterium]
MRGSACRSQRVRLLLGVVGFFLSCAASWRACADDTLASRLGVTRGVCVVLGDPRCELAVELAEQSELLVYVQLPAAEDVVAARRAAADAGLALAVGKNAAVAATERELLAVDLEEGNTLWTQPLPAPPVPWGLALGRYRQVLVTLTSGEVLCFQ